MSLSLSARAERWPLSTPFRIARGEKTEAHVVVVEARRGGHIGLGEGVPYPRYGESVESVLAQIAEIAAAPEGLDQIALLTRLPTGAARNAIDCALWDLEAKEAARSVADLLDAATPSQFISAVTIALDTPTRMGEAAAAADDAPILKVKLGPEAPEAALAAVRAAAPHPVLIVDPNEGWSVAQLMALMPALVEHDVALIEQPCPAGDDAGLSGYAPPIPICADEAFHGLEDLQRVAGRYQAVNVKLDKAGGLTAALEVLSAAQARGLMTMVGCMVCTSLSIAPALHLASTADFIDLDGAWWLKEDREPAIRYDMGRIRAPTQGWGFP